MRRRATQRELGYLHAGVELRVPHALRAGVGGVILSRSNPKATPVRSVKMQHRWLSSFSRVRATLGKLKPRNFVFVSIRRLECDECS